jgi:hypothetical protein
MKKRSLSNLKLKKQTISSLDSRIKGGAATTTTVVTITVTVPITYSIFFDCEDVVHTSKDYDGKHCDIATVNDSCFSVCDNICNDF